MSDRDGPVWARSYGHADAGEVRPVDAGTLFQIGSISKSFTAICLLRLWERGRLDLDAEVRSLLPWFPFDGITVHHLLSHTGGIVCSLGDPPSPIWEVLSLAQTARAPAGEHFWYSNVGYQALGLMLERLTGEPFADTYRREIIEPLGLAETEPLLDERPAGAHGRRPRAARSRPRVAARRPARPGDVGRVPGRRRQRVRDGGRPGRRTGACS